MTRYKVSPAPYSLKTTYIPIVSFLESQICFYYTNNKLLSQLKFHKFKTKLYLIQKIKKNVKFISL